MQPGGLRLLAQHPCRKGSPTGEGASGVVARGRLVSVSLLTFSFLFVYVCIFLGAGPVFLSLLYISLVRSQCVLIVGEWGGEARCCHRTRLSGRNGRVK